MDKPVKNLRERAYAGSDDGRTQAHGLVLLYGSPNSMDQCSAGRRGAKQVVKKAIPAQQRFNSLSVLNREEIFPQNVEQSSRRSDRLIEVAEATLMQQIR